MFGSFESHYFTFEFIGDIVVARCIMPNLSDEENIEPVGQELLTLIDKYECRSLIVDLCNVEYMTSSMIGKLIRVHRQLHRDGGKLAICNLNATVDDILRTSHLLSYFHSAGTLEEAVALFGDAAQDSPEEDEEDSGADASEETKE